MGRYLALRQWGKCISGVAYKIAASTVDQSLWPSQIVLACRFGKGSATPETHKCCQLQTTHPTVEHAYSTTALHWYQRSKACLITSYASGPGKHGA